MIKVPVKTKKGVSRVMRTRVPRTRTFALYRRAEAEAPDLLKGIYTFISRDVEAQSSQKSHRSSDLIKRVPPNWPYRKQWQKFSSNEAERESLFEQVLWTYFFDCKDSWKTTWPDKAQPSAVYVLEPGKRTVAKPARARPRRAASTPPPAVSRGIGMAPPAPADGTTVAIPKEQLGAGEIVEILRGMYKGLIGEITGFESEGPFISAVVKLPADNEYLEIPFRIKDIKKAT
jgi:hypothetical protein